MILFKSFLFGRLWKEGDERNKANKKSFLILLFLLRREEEKDEKVVELQQKFGDKKKIVGQIFFKEMNGT